jgi:hypothetical protein
LICRCTYIVIVFGLVGLQRTRRRHTLTRKGIALTAAAIAFIRCPAPRFNGEHYCQLTWKK